MEIMKIEKAAFPYFQRQANGIASRGREESSTNKHFRRMFPLRLSYAWTIWKAQGQTITSKVVADLGKKEREHGLTYTVFSRVKRSSDIGIMNGFPRSRIMEDIAKQSKMKARIAEERRLDNGDIRRTKQLLHMLGPM